MSAQNSQDHPHDAPVPSAASGHRAPVTEGPARVTEAPAPVTGGPGGEPPSPSVRDLLPSCAAARSVSTPPPAERPASVPAARSAGRERRPDAA